MREKVSNTIIFILLCIIAITFAAPVLIVLMNSFKTKFSISQTPFLLPDGETFAGLENYTSGIANTGFFTAFMWAVFITVFSVIAIVIFTSMTAWALVRVKSKISSVMYY